MQNLPFQDGLKPDNACELPGHTMSGYQVVAGDNAEQLAGAATPGSPPPAPQLTVVPPLTDAAPSDAGTAGSAPAATAAQVQQRLMLHMPVDVRSASMALIAVILSLYALQWAKEIVVPILCGVMSSYALTPVVDRMARWKLPRAAGATLLLTAILALTAWGAWALGDQTDALIDTVPTVTAKVRELSQRATGKTSTLVRVQKAAAELAAAAGTADAASAAAGVASGVAPGRSALTGAAPASNFGKKAQPAAKEANESPGYSLDVRGYLLSGTLGVMSFLGKIAVIVFVALFLMSSGNSFRRKMVKLAGPKLSQKKVTIETLDEITEQIQRYLLVQVGVSAVVGVCTWLAFMALGLNNAGVWGVVAGVTNLIPYVGALIISGGAAVVALVQFGTPQMALMIGASSFAVHTVIGNLLTPWWMGRASKMSPVAVFISVLIFGWLWGVWGLLLGVPILLVVKTVCDRVDDLKPVGELLGA